MKRYISFSSLNIILYPQSEYILDESPDEIALSKAMEYEDVILTTITKENQYFENHRDHTEYLDEGPMKEKTYSLYPSVEIHHGDGYIINKSLGVFICSFYLPY